MSSHAMIPVPQAIRCVLAQTVLELQRRWNCCICSSDDDWTNITSGDIVGRIAAEDVTMPSPGYPQFPVSVMDGYAMCLKSIIQETMGRDDSTSNEPLTLLILDSIYAGDETDNSRCFSSNMGAIYVTTGAILPYFVDTVIPVEEVTIQNKAESNNNQPAISILPKIWKKYYDSLNKPPWIRAIGFDIPETTVLLRRGQTIEVAHMGLILQAGYSLSSIRVRRKPIVGVLSTGNELCDSFSTTNTTHHVHDKHSLNHHRLIPDVNRPMLLSLLNSFDSCDTIDLGIVKDDNIIEMKRVLDNAMDICDVVITTGGISMGEKDLVQQALTELGCHTHFSRLHMKPGKPTTFLTCPRFLRIDQSQKSLLKACLLFALPGNPVSAFVCTHLLVRPCLDLLYHGINDTRTDGNFSIQSIIQNAFVHDEIVARIHHQQQPWKLDVERPEYHRVQIQSSSLVQGNESATNQSYLATTTGIQQSSRILSLVGASGLMVLPHLHGKLSALPGESYTVLLLNNPNPLSHVRVKDSLHIRSAKPTIGIIQFINNSAYDNSKNIQERVYHSLGGQNHVCLVDTFFASSVDRIQHLVQNEVSEYLDVVVIVSMEIPFLVNLKLSSMLTSLLQSNKISHSSVLLMRNAISSVNPVKVLHDPIFGYYECETKSFLIVSVPDNGLEVALESIAVMLKHTLFISRG